MFHDDVYEELEDTSVRFSSSFVLERSRRCAAHVLLPATFSARKDRWFDGLCQELDIAAGPEEAKTVSTG